MNLPKLYTEAKVSPQGKINANDVERWFKQSVIFGAVPVAAFLTQLGAGQTVQQALPYLYVALAQSILNLALKFQDGSK